MCVMGMGRLMQSEYKAPQSQLKEDSATSLCLARANKAIDVRVIRNEGTLLLQCHLKKV